MRKIIIAALMLCACTAFGQKKFSQVTISSPGDSTSFVGVNSSAGIPVDVRITMQALINYMGAHGMVDTGTFYDSVRALGARIASGGGGGSLDATLHIGNTSSLGATLGDSLLVGSLSNGILMAKVGGTWNTYSFFGGTLWNVIQPGQILFKGLTSANYTTLAPVLHPDSAYTVSLPEKGGLLELQARGRFVTGTLDTLKQSDRGKVIGYNSSSAISVFVPANLGGSFYCTLQQLGVGIITPVPDATVALENAHGYTSSNGQYSEFSIIFDATSTIKYIMQGDMQ